MFRFAFPNGLYLLALIPFMAAFLLWSIRKRKRLLERFGNPELMARLATGVSRRRRFVKALFLLTCMAFLAVALGRPQFGTRLQTVKREGQDIVVALDLSLSMLAEDVQPNRLRKAKHAIGGLIDRLRGDRIALVGFAGRAFVQCPLTLDYGAARTFLDSMDTDLIPVQGTVLNEAIEKSVSLFSEKEDKHKVIILVTDGEDHGGQAAEAAEKASDKGIVVFVVGVGSARGTPIPLRDEQGKPEGFKKDDGGEIVMTRLDESTLDAVAGATGGRYYRLSAGESEIGEIYDEVAGMDKKTVATQEFAQYQEQFQVFVAAALVLLTLELITAERRVVQRVWKGRFQ